MPYFVHHQPIAFPPQRNVSTRSRSRRPGSQLWWKSSRRPIPKPHENGTVLVVLQVLLPVKTKLDCECEVICKWIQFSMGLALTGQITVKIWSGRSMLSFCVKRLCWSSNLSRKMFPPVQRCEFIILGFKSQKWNRVASMAMLGEASQWDWACWESVLRSSSSEQQNPL